MKVKRGGSRVTTSLVFFVAAATLLAAARYVYVTGYRPVLAAEYDSAGGGYCVKAYMIGEPVFPFGPVKYRIDLYSGGKRISSAEVQVKNDGAAAGEGNFEVLFGDDAAYVRIMADEMDDINIVMYYNGGVEEQP